KDLDLVIFGATGFTGQFVVQEVVRTLSQAEAALRRPLRWAIAGRSEERLRKVLVIIKQLDRRTGDRAGPALVVADIESPDSLASMAQRAHVIATCVGPYRTHGEALVKACIAHGANYVDVTGEATFIGRSVETHGDEATRSGVAIVHACGYDSAPAEMGAVYATRLLEARNATPASIEAFYTFSSRSSGAAINNGTYEAAIQEMGSVREIIQLEQAANKKYQVEYAGPSPKSWWPIRYEKRLGGWTVPYFLTDGLVVETSQRLMVAQRDKKAKVTLTPPPAIYYEPYLLLPVYALPAAVFFVGAIALFTLVAQFPLGRRLLKAHPRLFTAGMVSSSGPNIESIESSSFQQHMIARGYSRSQSTSAAADKAPASSAVTAAEPDVQLEVQVNGPNPAYTCTAICLVQCAYVLLDRKQRKRVSNGVLTPAAAFWNTDLLDRLQANGLRYSV
ncbi:Saccharopine dehydrogenase-domain-containing protein, partial [Thamnocephalis sphaerospora]